MSQRKLKITSGEKAHSARVLDSETGQEIADVLSVDIHMTADGVTATITLYQPLIDIVAEGSILSIKDDHD
jgi:hypothetical protein